MIEKIMNKDSEQKSQYWFLGILASSSWYFWTNIDRKSRVMFQNCSGIVFWIQNMIEKHNGQRFGTETTILSFWVLASSSWYFWTNIGLKIKGDVSKLFGNSFLITKYDRKTKWTKIWNRNHNFDFLDFSIF